jgi:hypothetical protein
LNETILRSKLDVANAVGGWLLALNCHRRRDDDVKLEIGCGAIIELKCGDSNRIAAVRSIRRREQIKLIMTEWNRLGIVSEKRRPRLRAPRAHAHQEQQPEGVPNDHAII